uniref:Calx-beta domain-containing protein n=1 Tax=Parascaris univalens TaxID=6257 RepID=A0A915A8H3_PARUN
MLYFHCTSPWQICFEKTTTMILFLIFTYLITRIAAAEQNGSCEPAKPCSPGLLLPVWNPQQDVGVATIVFRAVLYFMAMLYMFFGVSIVADRFMAAIEVITSQEREVKLKKITGEPYTILIRIWNETVSNLTLIALGSSAPEILLSVIEIFGNNFEAGDLGPSTIVGSAAFNLFVIIGICIYAVPSPEKRMVQHNSVFWVTVAWSTFAYIWLYLIISVFSPGVIQVWEGVLTFIFFPLTVLSAYLADQYTEKFGRRLLTDVRTSFLMRSESARVKHKDADGVIHLPKRRLSLLSTQWDADVIAFEEHRKKYLDMFKKLRAENPDAPAEELEKLGLERVVSQEPKSRAFYRIQATRKLIGSGDIATKKMKTKISELATPQMPIKREQEVVVSFDPACYVCLESAGSVNVRVKCDTEEIDVPVEVTVHYRTIADTAQEYSDFVPTEGILKFEEGQKWQEIRIGIVDNDIYEEDEQFMVCLSQVRAYRSGEESKPVQARLGCASTATVLIVDDDHAGAFGFASEKFKVAESKGVFIAEVLRTRGARGEVSIPYKTIDGAAKAGQDYIAVEGHVRFKDEQTKAEIAVEIINDDEYEKNEDFYLELGEPIWHRECHYGKDVELGRPALSDHPRCKIVITEDHEFKNFIDKIVTSANTSIMVGTHSWKQQFKEAIEFESEKDGEPTSAEVLMHFLALPWKLLFASIPPTVYMKGWLCFFVAIFMIGILTAIIGDLASHFGCTVRLKDSITAISLVAMGTSVPDTFASRTAALQDQWADSSIGNVTGSNAVNVFLGIGIAWTIAAIYHAFNGSEFHVHAGSLAFSVTMFLIGSTKLAQKPVEM